MNKINVNCIEEVFKCNNKTGRIFNMNNRPTNAIVLVEHGKYIYTSKTCKTLSDPYHVIFLPKGSSYQLKCLKSDCSRIINFSGDLFANEPFSVEVKDFDELIDIFDKMATEQSNYLIFSQFYYLLHLLTNRSSYVSPLLRAPLEYMEKHFLDFAIKNDSLAAMSNISTVYFRKLFTDSFGCAPQSYLKQLRIQKAKMLLKLFEYSISEIAVMCGYENVYTFSSSFKTATGVCPTEFAKKYKKF